MYVLMYTRRDRLDGHIQVCAFIRLIDSLSFNTAEASPKNTLVNTSLHVAGFLVHFTTDN